MNEISKGGSIWKTSSKGSPGESRKWLKSIRSATITREELLIIFLICSTNNQGKESSLNKKTKKNKLEAFLEADI